MKALQRTLTWLIISALVAFGSALAQDGEAAQEEPAQEQTQEQQTEEQPIEEEAAEAQPETRTVQIQGEEVAPLGEVQVGESQALEDAATETIEVEVQTGAISFEISTPDDQSANVDIVGPNGYYEQVEVNSGDGEPTVVDGLLPGVYSIAATDDGLQVAHTLVEVGSGQIISVQATLEALAEFQEGAFESDTQTAFPDNAFQAEEPVAIEDAEFGEVTVETENDNTRFVITGPNNYSQEFTGSFTASDLAPGVYVVAGTLDSGYEVEGALSGAQIATSAVEVNVAQAVTFVPVYDVVGAETQEVEAETEQVEDVAGGGEAEAQPAEEQPTEEQPAEEQPTEEQPAEEQPAEDQAGDEAGEGPIEEPVEEAVDPDAEEQPAEEQPADEQQQ